jgi:hypothetical protein
MCFDRFAWSTSFQLRREAFRGQYASSWLLEIGLAHETVAGIDTSASEHLNSVFIFIIFLSRTASVSGALLRVRITLMFDSPFSFAGPLHP